MPIAIQEGYAPFRGYQTWYRVTGDLRAKKTPSVILHGGPGAAHDYVDAFKLLANSGPRRRPLRSARLRPLHPSARQGRRISGRRAVPGRARQPDRRISASPRLPRGRPVLGRHARRRARRSPGRRGCASLVIANSPASMELWVREANRLRADCRRRCRRRCCAHEEAGTTNSTGISGRRPGVLRSPSLPREAHAGGGDAQLRADRRRSDRLSHHERAQRIPRHRHAQGLEHHRPAAPRSRCRCC